MGRCISCGCPNIAKSIGTIKTNVMGAARVMSAAITIKRGRIGLTVNHAKPQAKAAITISVAKTSKENPD
ncbi:hypothetical protein Aam_020_049 [Acidocella aminolytica 101 = DSM 11237]|uniref:Uncharacterized protein n=1 Tax=Acidocella aminolytica 101 = DSM 11237 TaxID=1120923 RepID=A0A0D6PC00_9PROT|nr:hypothetical protein Aam_020_049 [Acidocella aminolytica 101 = DSM 11237]GBQ39643.1 hypothetical protein AA11237_2132 [Acidocella aminolytica 101 = DSM 11237]